MLSKLPAPKRTYASNVAPDSTDGMALQVRGDVERDVKTTDNKTSDFWQVVPTGPLAKTGNMPGREAIEKAKQETMDALQGLVEAKQRSANPKSLPVGTVQPAPQYIKYTPTQQSQHFNSGAEHRIIQMQDMPTDPMQPPKFRHQKAPRVPDTTPVPVLHSPPRALTKEDQDNWKIPPAVSAWKNAKGYTIPLDKRLAADGRGMQEVTINRKHMGLAQALYAAEETARSETELAARLQLEMKQREKKKKEEQLRTLAANARMGGAAGTHSLASRLADSDEDDDGALPPPPGAHSSYASDLPPPPRRTDGVSHHDDLPGPPPPGGGGGGGRELSRDEQADKAKRDEIREDRKRERERERRLEAKAQSGAKKSKTTRDQERDVSEKMALGQANVGGGNVQMDSRLFGQDQGINSGFAAGDDNYNMYDKPLFADRSTASLYRAKDNLDGEVYGGGGAGDATRTDRFRPDKGFTGTDDGRPQGGGERTGPVQFEKEAADPFGLDTFIAKIGK